MRKLAIVATMLAAACSKGNTGGTVGPGDQVVDKPADVKLDLPTPPEFPKIPPSADGTHTVTEMRRQGNKYLPPPPVKGQQTPPAQNIKVKGYVTWRYDCMEYLLKDVQEKAAVDGKKLSDAEAQKAAEDQYDNHHERCTKNHFYLADEQNASPAKAIWIVGVPKDPIRDWEKKDAKKEPDMWPPAPKFAVGDQVVVEGQWLTSSDGFINLDGELHFVSMEDLTTPADDKDKKKTQ
jgi:hypothetical protein